MMPALENALFITPTFPVARGIGPTLRARLFLDALAEDYHVHLVVVPLVGMPPSPEQLDDLSGTCAGLDVLALNRFEDPAFAAIGSIDDAAKRAGAALSYPWPRFGRFARREVAQALGAALADRSFVLVHVFRLYLAPLVASFAAGSPRPRLHLDLDDYESRTHARLASLLERRGAREEARFEASESEKYSWWEEAFLQRFDRVLVCSEHDRADLAARFSTDRFAVVPNAVELPAACDTAQDDRVGSPFTFLFVGTLSYFPNQDAVQWFCEAVLPQLRTRARAPFRLVVAGPHPPWTPGAFGQDVTFTGWIDDLAGQYRQASGVIVPIRAGGGTRIKILEAFAHRRPLVATSMAAEGVDAVPGRHFLQADDPASFAAACLTLMEQPSSARVMIDDAFDLVRTRYDASRVRDTIRRLSAA